MEPSNQISVGNFSLIDKAIQIAYFYHQNQFRKDKEKIPYIIHPLTVGFILSSIKESTEIIVAGILHDTVEDTNYTFTQIEKDFGSEITRLVKHVTHPMSIDKPYPERYAAYLKNIRQGGREAWTIALADHIHNTRSSIAAIQKEGINFWDNFTGGMQVHIDFAEKFKVAAQEDIPDHILLPIYLQLRKEWLKLIPEENK